MNNAPKAMELLNEAQKIISELREEVRRLQLTGNKLPEHKSWRPPNGTKLDQFSLQINEVSPQKTADDILVKLRRTWAARFYRAHLKKWAIVRRMVGWVWTSAYPFYVRRRSIFSYKTKENRWLLLIKLSDFVKTKNISCCSLVCEERVEIEQPDVFPIRDQSYLGSFRDQFVFPQIFVATLKKVRVCGGTNLVVADDVVICHDLYDFERDYTSEELHARVLHEPLEKRIRWLVLDQEPEAIPACATFVDACAVNYAHWLSEVMPRIALFCGDDRFKNIPIVVNSGLHQNIMESLFVLAGDDHEIITLPVGRDIIVDTLYLTSVAGYVPFEPRKDSLTRRTMRRGEFSPQALGLLRNHLGVRCQDEGKWPEKIYLRRNSQVRKLANTIELEELLISRDFVIVEPEKLTFLQQAQLFFNANVIIGASGAAFVNAVFCRPGSQVGILVAKNKELAYEYWINMLTPIGIKVSYILGETVQNEIHSDFEVDLSNLEEFLETLGRT